MKSFKQYLKEEDWALRLGIENPKKVKDIFLWDGKQTTARKILQDLRKWVDEDISIRFKKKVLEIIMGTTKKVLHLYDALVIYYGHIDIYHNQIRDDEILVKV